MVSKDAAAKRREEKGEGSARRDARRTGTTWAAAGPGEQHVRAAVFPLAAAAAAASRPGDGVRPSGRREEERRTSGFSSGPRARGAD